MSGYRTTFSVPRLWIILSVGMAVMFGTLLALGWEIYQQAPPIPDVVRSESGQVIYGRENITRGQQVWQSIGGMQQGSIWGHGGYLAPDWSADWLHREAIAYLDIIALREGKAPFSQLDEPRQEYAQALLRLDMRRNAYDPDSGKIVVKDDRAKAIAQVGEHYRDLYQARTPEAKLLRKEYAFPINTRLTDADAHALNAFYFWTSWATTTNREFEIASPSNCSTGVTLNLVQRGSDHPARTGLQRGG